MSNFEAFLWHFWWVIMKYLDVSTFFQFPTHCDKNIPGQLFILINFEVSPLRLISFSVYIWKFRLTVIWTVPKNPCVKCKQYYNFGLRSGQKPKKNSNTWLLAEILTFVHDPTFDILSEYARGVKGLDQILEKPLNVILAKHFMCKLKRLQRPLCTAAIVVKI